MPVAPTLLIDDLATTLPASAASHRVFEHVRLSISAGELVAVVGASGSGKSTLLACINGLLPTSCGRVLLEGEDAAGMPPALLRARIGLVQQRPFMFAGTVAYNLRFAASLSGQSLTDAQVESLLARCALTPEFASRDATALSVGEQQRVALARALVPHPVVLLLDEPTAALDPESTQLIEQLLTRVRGQGLALLLVTHDLPQARRLADRIYELSEHTIRELVQR